MRLLNIERYMFSFFLAKRFFHRNSKTSVSSDKASIPAIRIATAGIAVGLAVMIIATSVVKGFQNEVSKKLVGFTSHIEILDLRSFDSPEDYPLEINDSFIDYSSKAPGVQRVQHFSQKIGILKTQDDFLGIMLKGVGNDYDLSFLKQHVVEGQIPNFTDSTSTNSIVISRLLADQLGIGLGDKIYSYFFSNTIKQRRFKVSAIYDTHLSQFDKMFVLTDIYTVNRLNDWNTNQCSGIELNLSSTDHLQEATAYLQRHVNVLKQKNQAENYSVLPITDNPRTASVLSWLNLLDFNVMVILVIMMCVAGFSMISGLLILILERTTTIGLLKALGASNFRIQKAFLCFASLIIARGLLYGNILALTLLWLQSYFHIVHLDPQTYYIDSVPVEFNFLWILGINCVSLLVTVLVLVIPSSLVSRIEPAKSIRFD